MKINKFFMENSSRFFFWPFFNNNYKYFNIKNNFDISILMASFQLIVLSIFFKFTSVLNIN